METSKILNSLSLTAERDDSSDSLGILNMDKVKVFEKSSSSRCHDGLIETKEMNEKLKIERMKALKTLELCELASQRDQTKNIPKIKFDTINSKKADSLNCPKTPGFDRTDYVSYNSYKTLNITDLQQEHTINLECTGELTTPVPNKISFEPSEITGRSTLYRGEVGKKTADELTVEEILASSYSGNVRNLRQSLHFTTENRSRSSISTLPKSADISKITEQESSMNIGNTQGFSFGNARQADECDFMCESFTPAELMSSKLEADELAWAQEHRTIPSKYNTSFRSDQNKSVDKNNKSDFSMSSAFDGNNISQLTEFFRKRSENLYNMVSSCASPVNHEPVALIDDTINSTMSNFTVSERDLTNVRISSQSNNSKVADKAYSRKSDNFKTRPNLNSNQKIVEQKNESYILSLSSIASALKQINSDESGTSIMNRLFLAQRTKSGLNVNSETLNNKNSVESKTSYSLDEKINSTSHSKESEKNKENIDPIPYDDNNIQFCDTATFTESLLDTSDFKKLIENETYSDDEEPLNKVTELNQNTLTNLTLSPNAHNQQEILTKSKHRKNLGRFSKSPPRFERSNPVNNKVISPSKDDLLPKATTHCRSKSPSDPNELYAAAGASVKTITMKGPHRKRSRSASNHIVKPKIIFSTADEGCSDINLTKSDSYTFGNKDISNNLQSLSPIGASPQKSKNDNSSRKLIIYPNAQHSQIFDESIGHTEPIVSNPTITIESIRQIRKEEQLKKAHSSTRLNNEIYEIRSISPNFDYTRSDFRSPSPIPVTEKSKYVNSPLSSVYNSPRSLISSPNSAISLETTTNSERRYLTEGVNNHHHHYHRPMPSIISPDCLGKMSLPNYGLVTRQPSNLLVKSSSRCNSQCSSSSEFSHYDHRKLPIKVTCMQFSWGSVKLRTNNQKSMQIKNFSTKRLVLKVEISGPGFQIVNLENCGNLITLQAQECRSIVINFCPTVLGVAIGVLSFLPPQENSINGNAYRIPLYGYGGHAVVIPQGIQKGPIGLPFITMGELQELSRPLVRTFTIYNKGPLNAFVVICLSSLGLDIPRLCDCIDIEPKKALIQPEDHLKFRITFKPRRDDLKRLIKKISGVITLATLRIITGDEPTRQRIRNIIRKMNDTEKSKITSVTLDNCWKKFEQEILIKDLIQFKEQTDVAMELVSTLRTHEIALTLNHTVIDDTTTSTNLMFPDVDETIMFRTIISNSIYLRSSSSSSDNQEERTNNELWSVRPNKLEIDPFDKKTKPFFTIQSLCNTITQDFEVTSNFKHIFTITPSSGKILPNEAIEININFNQLSFLPKEPINIMVFMENEKIIIPVNIKMDNFPPNLR